MLGSMLEKFLHDKAGAIAVIAAVVIPVVIGFVGVGAEVSYWYYNQRKVQNAADAAAYAAAVQLRVEGTPTDMETAGVDAASRTGYNVGIGVHQFNSPPLTGAFQVADAVEVNLTENVPRLFSAVFLNGAIPMSARAVALIGNARPACVLALDPSADGAVTFTGTAEGLFENCDIAANSVSPDAVMVNGGADLETDCIVAVGGVTVSGSSDLVLNECEQPIENTHEFTDPYASVPEPDTTAPCEPQNTFAGPPSAVHDIGPGRYCGGLQINRTVNLDPGIYIVDGGALSVSSTAVLRGTGVTFFLTNGADLNINGTSEVQLSAPTTGPYAGLIVFADPDNAGDLEYNINGDSDSYLAGAIYSPSGTVVVNGTSTSGGGCTQVVARMVRVNGGAALGSDCTGVGTNPLLSVRSITLVE